MPAFAARNRLGLYKVEGTEGVDASPTPGSNAIGTIGMDIGVNANVIDDNELRGGLGAGDIAVGSTPMTVAIRSNMRGNGTPGTGPEWDDLWETCGLNPTAGVAMPASGSTTCLAGGTTTTMTLTVTATNWPASTSAGAVLLGAPIEVGGTESPAVITFLANYTVAGATATLTTTDTLGTATGTSTTVKVLPNVIYAPHSGVIPSGSFYQYINPVTSGGNPLWKLFGCRGDFSMEWNAGGKGVGSVNLNGVFGGRFDQTVTAATFPTTQPPIWVNGRMSVDKKAVAASRLSVQLNNAGTFPGNPNATEGLDPYLITGRSVQGSVNPVLTLTATRDLFADLRAQTVRVISACLGARTGGGTGNKFGLVVLNAKFRNYTMEDDGGVLRETVPFQCQGVNGEFYLSSF